jgi:hypothetical protein
MRPGALLLTPGAGSDRDHHTLVAIEEGVAPLPVARIDFPYRREGRRAPDRAPKLIDCVREEAVALVAASHINPRRLILGGRSMGGRMCSMAVAEGLPAGGLVLISYPLHPPGRAAQLRVEHLAEISVPCLFVSGTRDPFGTPGELEHHTDSIPAPVTHIWLDGQGHDLKRADPTIVTAVKDWLATIR